MMGCSSSESPMSLGSMTWPITTWLRIGSPTQSSTSRACRRSQIPDSDSEQGPTPEPRPAAPRPAAAASRRRACVSGETSTTGSGMSVASSGPTDGMKLSTKWRKPNTMARSTWRRGQAERTPPRTGSGPRAGWGPARCAAAPQRAAEAASSPEGRRAAGLEEAVEDPGHKTIEHRHGQLDAHVALQPGGGASSGRLNTPHAHPPARGRAWMRPSMRPKMPRLGPRRLRCPSSR